MILASAFGPETLSLPTPRTLSQNRLTMQPLPLTEPTPQEAPTAAANDAISANNNQERGEGDKPWIPLNSGDVGAGTATTNGDYKAAESSTVLETNEHGTTDTPSGTRKGVPPKSYTVKYVSTHKKPDDMWIIIDNEVYDVTRFQHEHPGGAKGMFSPL